MHLMTGERDGVPCQSCCCQLIKLTGSIAKWRSPPTDLRCRCQWYFWDRRDHDGSLDEASPGMAAPFSQQPTFDTAIRATLLPLHTNAFRIPFTPAISDFSPAISGVGFAKRLCIIRLAISVRAELAIWRNRRAIDHALVTICP